MWFVKFKLKDSEKKLSNAASLLLKGAAILQDPCLNCNGVQIKYKNQNICVQCDQVTTPSDKQVSKKPASKKEVKKSTKKSLTDSSTYKTILNNKINEILQLIDNESDIDKQLKLLSLIQQYVELIEKFDKIN